MSESVTRLTLISHSMTEAMRRARFASDEPIDDRGMRALEDASFAAESDVVSIAPERRTRQTADALGLRGDLVEDLADIDHGTWAGSTMEDLAPEVLLAWLSDTSTTPPCGESIDDLFRRVARWLSAVAPEGRRVIAVTHPAVIRAVVVATLDAPSVSFWRVDVPPSTVTSVHHRGGRWTLRSVAEKIT